jgi:hypothetical protein
MGVGCVCEFDHQAGARREADCFPETCDDCMDNEYALRGMECECLPGFFRVGLADVSAASASASAVPARGRCVSLTSPAAPEDTCVVNRRLPAFAIRLGQPTTAGSASVPGELPEALRLASGFGPAPPTSASRRVGGACHMGRLPVVEHTAELETNLSHTLQLCARAEDRLACHALEQNRARPSESRSGLGFRV